MKKIPNLFVRDWNGNRSRVLPVFNSEADVLWVVRGEGVATVKWDGAAVMVRASELFVRFDAKRGKALPAGFEPCQEEDTAGHRPGWIPAEGNPAAKWHLDAFANSGPVPDGTYEALGPQHNANPYKLPRNILVRHGVNDIPLQFDETDAVSTYEMLKRAFVRLRFKHVEMPELLPIEGIVWHRGDGAMVKCLSSDLGESWKAKVR